MTARPELPRTVVWFSRGVPSACAAKIAVDTCQNVDVVYCDTSVDEHSDGARFHADVERWIGKIITIIRSEKYRSVDDVFADTRYMSGVNGARCTVEMKKTPRFAYQRPDDIHVFGYTADENDRAELMEKKSPELRFRWILIEAGLDSGGCQKMIAAAGIAMPVPYTQGYEHNNCRGCVKATSPHYWNSIRRDAPEIFELRAKRSRELGVRLARLNGKRIFLDELPPAATEHLFDDLSCGPECT